MLEETVRKGPRLKAGDQVAIVSPASYPTPEHVADMVSELEGWGLDVHVGEHVTAQHGYMAGTDEARLGDLNVAIRDPEIRAIFASRGGAGSYRIADHIDIDAARTDPKPLIGFSDITTLHLTFWARGRLASVHGCIGRNQAADDVKRLIMDGAELQISADESLLSGPLRTGGKAIGPLVGGNLREIAGMVGAGLPDLTGSVLFVEDLRHIGLGQVDRNLTQLLRSGSLKGIAGIALGLFAGFETYDDRGWNLLDVLQDRLMGLGVPVLGGIKAGHGGVNERGEPDQRSLCLGGTVELDASAGTLTMGPCVS